MNWEFLKRVFDREPQSPDLEFEIERGRQARTLLESDAYQRATLRVRQGIHEKWSMSPVADVEGQHELRLILKAMDDIEGNLIQEMKTGELASEQLRRKQDVERKERERKSRINIRSI